MKIKRGKEGKKLKKNILNQSPRLELGTSSTAD